MATEIGVSHQSLYNWSKAWREAGLCGLLIGHNGGRSPALSPEMIASAVAAAREESMTLAKIALRVEAEHGVPLPCTLETLSKALKGAGLTYKRARFSLKKSATSSPLP
ncbi:helix-turn-helix domain-containing protein [Pseudomonas sp. MWU12-2534b]|nr:helix-turn-helix domain-containing protein [Pseudomonas sp. MWU12-2534b]